MKSETLSLKTITNELVYLRKTAKMKLNAWKKKKFIVVCKQFYKKIADPSNAKKLLSIIYKKEKQIFFKAIRNNY